MYELFDGVAVRLLLAIEPGESIRRAAQRVQAPYETARQAINALERAGFVYYDDGLYVSDDRVAEAALTLLARSARVRSPSIDEAYVLPQFADAPFAFTRIDAVYVWTRGGYQVARSPEDYPLFLAVDERDVDDWLAFFARFELPAGFDRRPADEVGALQVVLEPRAALERAWVDGYPVIPREETIAYMQDHSIHFQPALEQLDRLYDDLDLGVRYRDPGMIGP